MSIGSPNYDNLPSRQAEKREQERQAATDRAAMPAEALVGRGTKKIPAPWATCHPTRKAVNANGDCRLCLANKETLVAKADISPEQALKKVEDQGADKLAAKTLAVMQSNTAEYARLHLQAARVAALKGDARPAEWALSNVRMGEAGPVVVPVAKDGGGTGGGVKIVIGLAVGGLPPGVQAQSITVPAISVEEAVPVGGSQDTKKSPGDLEIVPQL